MKFLKLTLLWLVSLLIFSGCMGSLPAPQSKDKVVIDDTLPVIELTPYGTLVDMKTIAFEWKSIEDPRVRGIYIYRAALDSDDSSEDELYDTIKSRFSTHYIDRDVEPNSRYSYYFKTFSDKAQGLASKKTVIKSLPIFDSVSWIHGVSGMPRGAKIIWRPHPNKRVKGYIIQRRTLKADEWDNIKELDGRFNVEYIDQDLNDKYTYKYRVKSVTYDDIVSKPSAEVTITTKPLPMEVYNITATTNLPKKIVIKWDKYNSKDFDHYNIYRSDDVDSGYDLLARVRDNNYTDIINEDGIRFFYRVSVVDKDGLESPHTKNSTKGMTLVRPLTPAILEAKLVNGKVEIRWKQSDPRVVEYAVSKKISRSFFDSKNELYEGIKGDKFIDDEIYLDTTYYYNVYSVDKNGIKSEPSIEITIKTPKDDPALKQQPKEEKVEQSLSDEEVVAAPIVESVPEKDVVIINNDFN